MADFCKDCSISMFGKDHRDLADITAKESDAHGLASVVICEGCGVIQVNSEGECLSDDCLRRTGASSLGKHGG